MSSLLNHAKFSLDEYHRMIDLGLLDDKNVELLHGEIIEMPPEGPEHFVQNQEAERYLSKLLGNRALVRMDGPITLPNGSEPEPDIVVCQPLGREYRLHHPYPQNIYWIIEYANTTLDRDLKVKSKIYAEVGIREYWIVNLRINELMVMRSPAEGEYSTQTSLKGGQIIPLAFPNLQIEVVRIINP